MNQTLDRHTLFIKMTKSKIHRQFSYNEDLSIYEGTEAEIYGLSLSDVAVSGIAVKCVIKKYDEHQVLWKDVGSDLDCYICLSLLVEDQESIKKYEPRNLLAKSPFYQKLRKCIVDSNPEEAFRLLRIKLAPKKFGI